MSELERDARDLVEVTRAAYDPSATHRARVRWRLERAIASAPPPARANRWRPGLGLAAAALVLAIGGAAAPLAFRGAVAPAAPAVEPSATASVRHAPPTDTANPTPQPPPEASVASPRAAALPLATAPRERSASVAAGDLAAEAALLARAQAATNRGQSARALALLGEYDRQYGRGALAEERAAARVFALCGRGDVAQARAEAQRFLQRWPRSPQAARIRDACRAEARP